MQLSKLSDIRRQELRRAAVVVMQREGAAGTTLEKVAVEAGASKGIVLHYFRNKQELFEHAMREANTGLRDSVVQRLKNAETPFQRLWGIIDENLGAAAFRAPHGHAWLSLCAEAPREPQLARIQKVISCSDAFQPAFRAQTCSCRTRRNGNRSEHLCAD